MRLAKWTFIAVTTAAVVITGLYAQAQKKEPLAFEVASIKPTRATDQRAIIRPMPGNQAYTGSNVTLRLMMTIAYSVTDRQISGAPGWVDTDRFDIEARAARPGTVDELHDMLANLLEERFKLKVRRETKEQAVWNLVLDKGGAKLVTHSPDDINYPPIRLAARGELQGQNVKTDYLAFFLSRFLDRKVIDKTGLPARYDFRLSFRPDTPADAPGAEQLRDVPDIFTAVREQLGLRLESGRGPVEYLVVEKVEKLTEN
ncbi:MAG TPA: TIGR03435 family protein [Bryobacteraceae bacterium]|jgi:uncharacterized protein (TIGR03435 family)|nr:TIGR03435 family protein [Bryobacteraceae bacterium]